MALLPAEPDRRRQFLLGMLLVGMVAYAAFEYLHKPASERVQALETRLESLQRFNQAGRAASGDELEPRWTGAHAELRALETLLAREEEVPDLLDAISTEAERSGLRLLLLQPTAAREEAFYVRRTYDLAVRGAYHDIGYFLSRIAALPRTVTPSVLSLAPQAEDAQGGPVQLDARFSIQTYVSPAHAATEEVTHEQ